LTIHALGISSIIHACLRIYWP